MKNELSELIKRPVDLMTHSSVDKNPNPITRSEILRTARIIYETKPTGSRLYAGRAADQPQRL